MEVQTYEVKTMLENANPGVKFEVGLSDTIGDQVQDKHLRDIGISAQGGLFTKSLEDELLAGKSHFAVHSLKDMPTNLPPGLVLAAICKRENPEDAVIIHPRHKKQGRNTLSSLPAGSVVGTSSLRREALTRRLYPSLAIKTIRGNIQTRLQKLQNGDEYDAIIVAAAGFRRGGLEKEIDELLPTEIFGYGVGQGSIGIECRANDMKTLSMLSKIEHEESAQCCKAERSLLNYIEGGCQISMGVNTILNGDTITMTASLLSQDGKQCITESVSGSRLLCEQLGRDLGDKFLSNDAAVMLLGNRAEKRGLTYGNVEAPGEAAAAELN